jgi:putative ABC transport system permease protein
MPGSRHGHFPRSRPSVFLEAIWCDLRYAARTLRKNLGFTAVAVLTLALAIGANTAIFSLINALLLRTLAVRDPGQLVELLHSFPGEPRFNGFSGEAFQLMRDNQHVFSGLIGAVYRPFQVRDGNSAPRTVDGGYVDGNFFSVLGLAPSVGRLIGPEDDPADHPSPIAVVSWSYWKDRFNSDPAILGKQIVVENVSLTIIGVAPRSFPGLRSDVTQDLWLPLALQPAFSRSVLGWGSVSIVGRLKPGVSIEQARAEMAVLFHDATQAPNANPFLRNMKLDVEPVGAGLTSPLRQQYAKPLLILMAVVSILLLIACTNVASLLLARGAARQHEMAVRVALGAGRFRLVRQVLTESLMLSAIGSLVGVVIAFFGAGALVGIIASGQKVSSLPLQMTNHKNLDLRVLLFTVGVTLLTGLLFGLAPALRAFKSVPISAMRQSGSSGETRPARFFAKSLVVTQVALSVVGLGAAVMFVGYLSNLERLSLGFQRDHLLLLSLDPARSGYKPQEFSLLSQQLLSRLETVPGVRSATISAMTPISGAGRACYCVSVEGHEEAPGNHRNMVTINWIAPNYFTTYGTPLLAGRAFSAQDQTGPRVAIINQSMARQYFGAGSAVGKHLLFDQDNRPYEIVGVAADAKYSAIRETGILTIFLNTFQEEHPSSQLTLRTSGSPYATIPGVSSALGAFMKGVSVSRETTMEDQVDSTIVPERLITLLSAWFGGLGALLAAIGLYGLLAFSVARRVREIGVRMALGASPGDVSRMILGDALRIVCAGLAIGALFALWGKRFAASLVTDLPSNNFLVVLFGATAILAVAMLAAWVPVRRAARVDPMVALRHE